MTRGHIFTMLTNHPPLYTHDSHTLSIFPPLAHGTWHQVISLGNPPLVISINTNKHNSVN